MELDNNPRSFPFLMVLGELLVLLAIPLVLNFASIDLGWLTAQTWYSSTILGLTLGFVFALQVALLAHSAKFNWLRNFSLLIAVVLLPYIYKTAVHPPQNLKGRVAQWLHDDMVAIQVPQGTSGNLLAEENYDLPLTVENRTSMPLEITMIEVKKYNPNAAQTFGSKEDEPIHTST